MTADIIDLTGHRNGEEARHERGVRYWMKHDVRAFAFETSTTDAEGAGALILLRGHYFITGCLPKTDAECAKVCRLSARKFARLRSWLFSFFDEQGRSAELDASIEEAERISEKRREAGRKGGLGKALANARALPQQNPTQSQSQSQSDKQLQSERTSSSPSPAPPPAPYSEPRAREAKALVDEATQRLSIGQRAALLQTGLTAWVSEKLAQGTESVDIAIGLGSAIPTLNGRVPTTPRYFEQPVQRARDARLRPLPEASGAVSKEGLIRHLAERIGVGVGVINALGADWLAEQHGHFVARTTGMPELVAATRERLSESFMQNTPQPLGGDVS